MSAQYAIVGDGNIIIRLSDGAHIPVDEGNDDYLRYLSDVAAHAGDASYVISGHDPRSSLADIASTALSAIDVEAERIRLRYLTPGTGQALLYSSKLTQVAAWQAATAAERRDLTKWPLLEAEVDATELQPAAAVAQIVQANREWETAAARIERIRIRCKRQIAAAATPIEVFAARDDGLAQLRAIDKQ